MKDKRWANEVDLIEFKRVAAQSEDSFRLQVEELARINGWLVYHTHRSEHSAAGYPDDTFVRPPRLIFVEFKRVGGKRSRDQALWLLALSDVRGVEVYVWSPDVDFDMIGAVLAH